jgi:hypothetical protein
MAEILRRTLEQQLRSGTGPVVSLRDLPRHAGGGLKQPLEDADVLGEIFRLPHPVGIDIGTDEVRPLAASATAVACPIPEATPVKTGTFVVYSMFGSERQRMAPKPNSSISARVFSTFSR